MTKHILAAAIIALSSVATYAADDTMYLIKGENVVAKYNVDDVDYISFSLPEGVSDQSINLKVNNVGKNTVTYTVNTQTPGTCYAHNIFNAPYLDMMALSYEGDYFENLEPEMQVILMQELLMYDAFLGMGSDEYTQTDYAVADSYGSRFSVIPGTKYYLCGWEIDPISYEPKETFVYTTFETLPAQTVDLGFSCVVDEINEYGVQFKFTGSSDVLYVRTAYGEKEVMDIYAQAFGVDFLMTAFGNNWDLSYLQSTGEIDDDVSNSIWPAYEPGDYVMFARAYNASGDYQEVRVDATVEGAVAEGPSITIYSKEKGEGYVSVNFEISPSNVEEAYVRLMGENNADDRLNMGYTLFELAMGGDAIDITNEINTTGEYTYTNNEVEEQWNSLLIYAKDKEGNKTVQRLNFYPDSETRWSTPDPVYGAPARKAIKRIKNRQNPTIAKLGKK